MRTIQEIIKAAEGFASGRIAVAAAHDADVLKAVAEAKKKTDRGTDPGRA